MSPIQTCPNCSPSIDTRIVFTLEFGIRVLECRGCGLQFAEVYPEMGEADSEIYGDPYFAGTIALRPAREKIFAELLEEIESVSGGKGRLLDVGCGDGMLLEVAARVGWEVEGTDIATAAVRYARDERGLTVHKGAIEDLSLEPGSYDVVVLNHSLEHVRNPRATLVRVRELLRTEGVARIEVPNLSSLSARVQNLQSRFRLKKHRWRHYETGHHFWFFTPRTLSRTIRFAGLSPRGLCAPAAQWGRGNIRYRATEAFYVMTLWGGHLIAYARKPSQGSSRDVEVG